MNIENKVDFFSWLIELLRGNPSKESLFVLKNFVYWNNELIDIPFRIIKKDTGGSFFLHEEKFLFFKVPFQDKWIQLISSKTHEGIVTELLLNGIGKYREILACFEISKKVVLGEKNSVVDYENLIPHINHNLPQFDKSELLNKNEILKLQVKWTESIFSLKSGCCNLITVWQTEIVKEEARSRTGEGYKLYIRECKKVFSIFFDNCLIDDDYLRAFLPENTSESETDHIPRYMPETFSYSSRIDEKATEEIRKSYNPIEHYKFLLMQGRPCKEIDLEIFTSSANYL